MDNRLQKGFDIVWSDGFQSGKIAVAERLEKSIEDGTIQDMGEVRFALFTVKTLAKEELDRLTREAEEL